MRPLKGKSAPIRALAIVYYAASEEGVEAVTSSMLRQYFSRIRAKDAANINAADILSKLGASDFLEAVSATRPISWKITNIGEAKVRAALELPEDSSGMRAEIAGLTTLAKKIASEETRDFLLESISCLGANALRAAIVFVWSGAVWTVQEWLMKQPLAKVNSQIARHRKTRDIKTIDDFAYVNDSVTLLVARDLGLWDKGQHTIVEHALGLRNQCGHPSRYKLPASRCKSVIEELVTLVFEHAV